MAKFLSLAILTSVGAVASSFLSGSLWIKLFTGQGREAYVPNSSDFIDYWREITVHIASFSGTGYFGYQEMHARIWGSGAHGLFINLLYSAIGRIFGWTPLTPVLANCLAIFLSIIFFIILTKPSYMSMLLLLLSIAINYPICSSLSYLSPDILSYSLGLIIAAMAHLSVQEKKHRPRLAFFTIIILCVAILIRKSWIFFLPFILVTSWDGLRVIPKKALLIAIFLPMVAFGLASATAAPYPFQDTMYGQSLTDFFNDVHRAKVLNILHYSLTSIFSFTSGTIAQDILAILSLFFSSLACVYFYLKIDIARASLFLAVIVSALGYILTHYFDGLIFIRHVLPFFFIPLYGVCLSRAKSAFIIFIAVNALLYPIFLNNHRKILYPDYRSATGFREINALRERLGQHIICSDNTSRWDNTIDTDDFSKALLAMPCNLSFNFVSPENYTGQLPLKSHFLFLSHGLEPFIPLLDHKPRLIISTEFGDLYENLPTLSD